MTHIIIYDFTTKSGLRDQVVESFQIMENVAGLNSYDLYKKQDDESRLTCVEHWESEQAHEDFLASFSLEQITQFESMFSVKPEAKVYAAA
ncbi:MAG: hypothetical protein COC19_04295 [SAR86 cluster bacterium]|uniref:ABM domain-containing protein n=1 Tax=SAR86 cluster bacterium TaxID=2030880 RepID=A0A2A4MPC5_9GAMM|nr:MAG: hypothetical protein COC19_04295 [SAR86 cluster bacterium]